MFAASLRSIVVILAIFTSTLFAADLFVDAATGSDTFNGTSATVGAFPVGPKKTVAAGVSVAAAGDTVNIAAGTYIEQLSLTTGVKLLGAGKASTFIQFPAAPVPNVPNNSVVGSPVQDIAVIYAGAAGTDVTLEALAVQGPAPFDNPALYGIFAGNTTHLVVTNCDVKNIRHNPLDGTQRGNGIQVGRNATLQVATATLTNVQVFGYQKTGIIVDGLGRDALIDTCVVTGTGPTASIAQNGIQVSRGATATIRGSSVSGNFYTPPSTSSCDVLGFQSGAITIENSTFTGSNIAVYAYQNSGLVSVTGSSLGTLASGNQYGMYIDEAGAAVTLSGNTLTNNTIEQIAISDTTAKAVTFTNANTITGGAVGITVRGNPVLNLGDTLFSGQSGNIISLAAGALNGSELAATGVSVDGTFVSAMTRTQLFALEDRIAHGVDAAGKGLARVVAATVFVTPASGSIQAGINIATVGDKVLVAPGTYNENVDINKRVELEGSGSGSNNTVDTIVTNPGNVITISASGLNTANRTSLRFLRVTGGTNGVFMDSAISAIGLEGVTATKLGQHGVHIGSNAIISNLDLLNCDLSGNDTNLQSEQVGLWIVGAVDLLTITGGHFDNNTYGLYAMQMPLPANPLRSLSHVTITGTTFSNNFCKGIYLEKIEHALLKDIVVDGSGYNAPANAGPPLAFFAPPAGIDINLKYATYTDITLENATVTNCGKNDPGRATSVAIKGRNDPSSYNTVPALLDGVQIKGGTFETPPFTDRPAFSFGNNTTNVVFSGGVSVIGTGFGISSYVDATTTSIDLGNTSLANTLTRYLVNLTAGTMLANGVNFNVSDNFAIENKINHAIDISGLGVIRWNPGHIYVTTASFIAPTTTTPSLQRAVDAALAGDIVHVQAGSYAAQNVTFPVKALTFSGPNAGIDPNVGTRVAEAIVSGACTFTTSNGTSALVIDGFTFDQVTNSNGVISASGASDNVTIRCNRFLTPGPNAVYAVGTPRSNWTVTQNRVTNVQGTTSGAFSATGPSGMRLYDLTNLTCSYNFISATPYAGILTDAITGSTITGNRVSNVPEQGIQVAGASSGVTVSFNEVNNVNTNQTVDKGGIRLYSQNFTGTVTVNNNIVTGSVNGIAIRDGSNDVNAFSVVRNNQLSANTRGVYRASGGTGTLNAEANWWGSPQGPTDASNPFGLGNLVSAGVDFTPFLSDGTDNATLNTSSFAALQASVGFQNNAALAGAAQRLVFTTQPVGGVASSVFATQPVVQVQDTNGSVATTFNGIVSVFLAANPTAATLSGTTVLNFTAGSATFTDLSLNKAATGYQLLAMSSTLPWALSQTFNIQSVPNPIPTLTSLSPSSTVVGSQPLALTLTGTNFVDDSVALFDGQPRPTIYMSPTQLIAVLQETDLDAVGTFAISVLSPTPGGGTTAGLTFSVNAQPTPNTPPQMLSQATAFPNPATPGQTVAFNAAAFDVENQTLTYVWNFGDSTGAGGPTAEHAFTVPGIYKVTIIVTDSAGGTSGSSVNVTVAAAAAVPNEPFSITSAKFKTFTPAPAKDTLQLAGAFALPTGVTSLTGAATLLINGKSLSFTVNSKGKAKTVKDTLAIRAKLKKGLITSPNVSLRFKGFGDYGSVLVTGGRPVGTAGTSTLTVQLIYAGKTYEGTIQVLVKPGKTGSTAK